MDDLARAFRLIDSDTWGEPEQEDLLVQVETLHNMLATRARDQDVPNAAYQHRRRLLVTNPLVKDHLPRFLETCRSIEGFWAFIQPKSPTYRGRGEFLEREFQPVLDMLEGRTTAPADEMITGALSQVNSEHVRAAWNKALERRASDPDGAITAARTLLETVLKYILDELGVTYDGSKAELPNLYHAVATQLGLTAKQQVDDEYRKLAGACAQMANSIAAIRNRQGDAHGKGKNDPMPDAVLVDLMVTVSGALAMAIIKTWEQRQGQPA